MTKCRQMPIFRLQGFGTPQPLRPQPTEKIALRGPAVLACLMHLPKPPESRAGKGEKKMAVLGALGGLILVVCALAALRSKQASAWQKIRNLSIK